jgi:hypothetical protein
MEIKKKNITITLGVTKKVADIIISISIPFEGIATCCLKRLKCNCGEPGELMVGSEEAAMAFATFEVIRDKLTGSGLEIFKTKVSNVDCYSIDKHLTINFSTQGTGTSLRKTVGIVMSTLNPIKLFSKYSENIKFLSGKGGNREEFNYCAKKLADGIKKGIHITAVGKINTDKSKLSDILDVIVSKIPELELPSAKEISSPQKRQKDTETYSVVKCSGLTAVAVADYLRNTSNGMAVELVDSGVIVYNMSAESKIKQLNDKKRIEDFVYRKYDKLEEKDELSAIFAYFALSQGYANANTAGSIALSKLKPEKLIELIKKAL